MWEIKMKNQLIFLIILIFFFHKPGNTKNAWMKIENITSESLYSINFFNETEGWIQGDNNTLLLSSDGGFTWRSIASSVTDSIQHLKFDNILNGYGYSINIDNTTFYRTYRHYSTINSGDCWTRNLSTDTLGLQYNLEQYFFFDQNHAWLTFSWHNFVSFILLTEDATQTWQTYLFIPPQGDGNHLNDLHFFNHKTGWITGAKKSDNDPTPDTGFIGKSKNQGKTWKFQQNYFYEPFYISAFDSHHVWIQVLGVKTFLNTRDTLNYHYIKTLDEGESWVPVLNTPLFNRFIMMNELKGWGITDQQIFKTENGGSNWDLVYIDSLTNMKNLQFISPDSGWVLDNHKIVQTTNGGLNWQTIFYDSSAALNSFFFLDNNHGWAVGENGSIWVYKNFMPPIANFSSDSTQGEIPFIVHFNDHSTGIINTWQWNFGDGHSSTEQHPNHTYEIADTFNVSLKVTGPGGSDTRTKIKGVIATDLSSVKNHEEPFPTEFVLYPNYPNPFNPNTQISFSVKEKCQVRLSIYNINGQLIKKLIHSEKKKGVYHVKVNTIDMTSGIYFYTIKMGNFVQTRKTIKLK